MNNSLLLRNATIVDVEKGTSFLGNLSIKGNRIYSIEPGKVSYPESKGERIFDLAGATVVPGFIDSHAHLTATGFSLLEIDARPARSISDILDLLKQQAAIQPPETMIRAWGLQENLLKENRFPTKEELDQATVKHFVRIMREDGHASVVNSKALKFLGFTKDTPGVDIVAGELTGVLRGVAQTQSDPRFRELETPELREKGLRAAAQQALKVGLTTVNTLEGSNTQPHEEFLEVSRITSGLPIHIVLWYQTSIIQRVQGLGLTRIGGCIMVDGAPGSYTGALFEPYSDNPNTSGILYFSDEELNSFVLEAHRSGYQIALHATCQRAVEQALTAYELALDTCPKTDHRLRIEHGYGLPTKEQFERMGKRGIILSTQPAFLYYRMDMYHKRFGERWNQVHPHKLALNQGVIIAGGSDSFVTPLYPLLGIHCAVNHPVEEQRVGVEEALRWFTINGAYAVFEDNDLGSIKPGKRANLTILGNNILTIHEEKIKDIPVLMTIIDGEVRYQAKELILN